MFSFAGKLEDVAVVGGFWCCEGDFCSCFFVFSAHAAEEVFDVVVLGAFFFWLSGWWFASEFASDKGKFLFW